MLTFRVFLISNGYFTQICQSRAILAKLFGKCRQVWRILIKLFGKCRQVWQVSHFPEKMAILSNVSICQKWTYFGEYSHSLNLLASSHCLVSNQTLINWKFLWRAKLVNKLNQKSVQICAQLQLYHKSILSWKLNKNFINICPQITFQKLCIDNWC